MRCQDVADRLTDLMEGSLDPGDEAEALAHLADCGNCERVLVETQEVVRLARDHGRPVLSDSDRARMFASIVDGVDRSDGA